MPSITHFLMGSENILPRPPSGVQASDESSQIAWIAIEPPRCNPNATSVESESSDIDPPSFGESRFDIILRRQRMRPKDGSGQKLPTVPSRFLNLSNSFEFAGWGSFSTLNLSADDYSIGEEKLQYIRSRKILGQLTASALAGNAVLGSVFYALPAVITVSSIYSPISLLVATLTLFLWRPIMEELASALPISGAPYTFILNVSTKPLALVGASLLFLDFASTSVVSAATAVSYLAGEVSLPFPAFVGVILILAIFAVVSLTGIKESARIASVVLILHVGTMVVLIVVSCVRWGTVGNSQLKENWSAGRAPSTGVIVHQIFNGFCLGMLGLTGFECTPTYIARIKPGRFPLILRNLHIPAMIFNVVLMLQVLALIPLETILQGVNVLSILAQVAVGRWLRIWIAVDAIVVLCGGVLTGILSACELFERLAHDRIIPKVFLQVVPLTGSPYISVLSFIAFSGVIYASAGASLSIVSEMFSLVWLTVMVLFPLSLLLLKFNRGRLPRHPQTPLCVILFSFAVGATVFAGNIAINPGMAGYFAAYFIGIFFLFYTTQNKSHLLRWAYWTYDQYPLLHTWHLTKTWGKKLIKVMTQLKRQPVCILVKTDEINHLFRMILYVQKNEETSCLKIIHFSDGEKGIPSELEANAKILDEAFPEITIDLIIVHGSFEPPNIAALGHRLQIPPSLMFMSCPGQKFPHPVAEFGTRIITL